ncbi:YbaN family protein [uncultured Lentibacter sp.]|uniref:YbaN family protein n=1 Tax=uncultured Lentibacter sp. TaxID=1659309 RepID=UPI0026144F66|nr:YbaN family protein [uncultured Lentibacter sp.]MCW1955779.1 YbaN family protein [Roseobacter sp.]
MRFVWLICGIASLGAGGIGVVLPLVPTVPFLLLAAFCFARSSERLHGWLMSHPRFGPSIADWQERGAISKSAKRMATVSIGAVFLLSLAIGLKLSVLAIQAVTLGCVLVFIWSRPN